MADGDMSTRERVEQYLGDHPEAQPSEVGEALGLSASTAGYHTRAIRAATPKAKAKRARKTAAALEQQETPPPVDDDDDDGTTTVSREYLDALETVHALAREVLRLRGVGE